VESGHVRRVKHGTPSTHPIVGDELRALRRLQRDQEAKSPFVCTSDGVHATSVATDHGSRQKARCAPIKPQIYCGKELSNYYKRLLLAGR
jgi:hypothetical protein